MRKLLAVMIAAGTALAVPGCAGETTYYVVEISPPAPRREVVEYRPGYVWVQGHWVQSGSRWVWRSGYYVRERPGMVFVHGHYARARNGQVYWVAGGWRTRSVVEREHY